MFFRINIFNCFTKTNPGVFDNKELQLITNFVLSLNKLSFEFNKRSETSQHKNSF